MTRLVGTPGLKAGEHVRLSDRRQATQREIIEAASQGCGCHDCEQKDRHVRKSSGNRVKTFSFSLDASRRRK